MNRYNRSRRPSAYTSTPEQHLAAKVEVYPKGTTLPAHIKAVSYTHLTLPTRCSV